MAAQEDNSHPKPDGSAAEETVTLEDLAQAFAEATGQVTPRGQPDRRPAGTSPLAAAAPETPSQKGILPSAVPVNPKSILEALLFVGHPHNQPLSPAQAAGLMRGVRPEEIAALVTELNRQYESTGRPYRIVFEQGGYRMKLLPEFDSLREQFFGKVRPVRLSQQALEVLAIVAYRQPITLKEINRLRGKPSGSILAQLVRRDLITVTHPEGDVRKNPAYYRTTRRFLELFKLQSLEDLPQIVEPGTCEGERGLESPA